MSRPSLAPLTAAKRGDWWQSFSGAIYLVVGPEYAPGGERVLVRVFWITAHTPPQVQETRLAAAAFRSIMANGTRLDAPPTVNHNGAGIAAQVADALARLKERP
jgi:hypothetical protein